MLLTAERLLFGWAQLAGSAAAGSAGARVSVTGHKSVVAVVRFDAAAVASLRSMKVGSSTVSGSVGAQAVARGYVLFSPVVTGDVLAVVIGGRVIA